MNIKSDEKLIEEKRNERKQFDIWVEKYRPLTIDEVILPDSSRRFFRQCLKKGEIPSLLLFSVHAGTGKTSTAKALCEELGTDYLYVNTSLDTGIDLLRNKIESFATSVSLSGKRKIVILDEFDGSSISLQNALRASIESFHRVCSFIIICNHINKIIKPIRSRCQQVDFNFADKKQREVMTVRYATRIRNICNKENIEVSDDLIIKIVNKFYPDLRETIHRIQKFSSHNNGVVTEDILLNTKIDDELLSLIMSKQLTKARSHIIQHAYDYDNLYRYLYDNLIPQIDKTKQPYAIIKIAEYMYQSAFVCDPEITFAACMSALMGVV